MLKSATGLDGISSKILKLARPVIVKPITNLINLTIECSKFPDNAKKAMVTPLHKKIATLIRKTTALLAFYLLFLRFMKGQ